MGKEMAWKLADNVAASPGQEGKVCSRTRSASRGSAAEGFPPVSDPEGSFMLSRDETEPAQTSTGLFSAPGATGTRES